MTKLRTRHMALIISVAAIAAAGCGSSSSSKTPAAGLTPSTGTSSTTTTPTSGFSAQLNALCTQGTQATKGKTTGPMVAAAIEPFLPKLEALKPPAAQKATYAEYVSNLKAEVAAAKKTDLPTLKKLAAKERTLGGKLGAPACAA